MEAAGQAEGASEGAPSVPETLTADLCVIGAGPGGLALAVGAAALGRRVVLIERDKMGGASLHHGAVPSKALLAVAKRAHAVRTAAVFGIGAAEPVADLRGVHAYLQGVVASLARNASAERAGGLGVRVVRAAARFIDKSTVVAGQHRIKARRFVIASGSVPLIPVIAGLDSAPYFTNETIFDTTAPLAHLLVLGGGSVALELAQAYRRLGSRVTVLAEGKALALEDPELARVVLARLAAEDVEVIEDAQVERIDGTVGQVRVRTAGGAGRLVEGSHLLVVVGRRPAVADLGLDAAGVRHDEAGIKVNAKLKTTNHRVYAIGDVTGGPPSVHAAVHQADIVVRRLVLGERARFDATLVPRLTFTDPELAHVGLSEAEAARAQGRINVLRWPYCDNDRARAESNSEGHCKVVTSAGGRVLGAAIAGAAAGELIQIWSLAVAQKLTIGAMSGWISPYPTLGEINKRAAKRYYVGKAGSLGVRRMISLITRLG